MFPPKKIGAPRCEPENKRADLDQEVGFTVGSLGTPSSSSSARRDVYHNEGRNHKDQIRKAAKRLTKTAGSAKNSGYWFT